MSYSVFPANLLYESKIGVPTSDFTPQKANYHQARPYPLFKPSMVDSQSMINGQYIFSYIEMDLYNQNLVPTIYTLAAAKQVGLNSFPPKLNAQCNCLPPFQPYQPLQSEQDSLVPSVSHLRWARRRLESGVGATSKKGKWAEQLGRRWEKKSMLSQCLMMVVKVSVVEISRFPPIYESKFGTATTDFRPK